MLFSVHDLVVNGKGSCSGRGRDGAGPPFVPSDSVDGCHYPSTLRFRMPAHVGTFLGRLEGVTETLRLGGRPQSWTADCPCDGDNLEPHDLEIGLDAEENIVLFCQAGCSRDDILAALSLQRSDLRPPPTILSKQPFDEVFEGHENISHEAPQVRLKVRGSASTATAGVSSVADRPSSVEMDPSRLLHLTEVREAIKGRSPVLLLESPEQVWVIRFLSGLEMTPATGTHSEELSDPQEGPFHPAGPTFRLLSRTQTLPVRRICFTAPPQGLSKWRASHRDSLSGVHVWFGLVNRTADDPEVAQICGDLSGIVSSLQVANLGDSNAPWLQEIVSRGFSKSALESPPLDAANQYWPGDVADALAELFEGVPFRDVGMAACPDLVLCPDSAVRNGKPSENEHAREREGPPSPREESGWANGPAGDLDQGIARVEPRPSESHESVAPDGSIPTGVTDAPGDSPSAEASQKSEPVESSVTGHSSRFRRVGQSAAQDSIAEFAEWLEATGAFLVAPASDPIRYLAVPASVANVSRHESVVDPSVYERTRDRYYAFPLGDPLAYRTVASCFYQKSGSVVSSTGFLDACLLLPSDADRALGRFSLRQDSESTHPGSLPRLMARRIAFLDGAFYIDLADGKSRILAVDRSGWRYVDHSPVAFIRTSSMLPLPEPREGGSLEDLRRLLGLSPGLSWTAIRAWLIGSLNPYGPIPPLLLHDGERLSTAQLSRFLPHLLDPERPAGGIDPGPSADRFPSYACPFINRRDLASIAEEAVLEEWVRDDSRSRGRTVFTVRGSSGMNLDFRRRCLTVSPVFASDRGHRALASDHVSSAHPLILGALLGVTVKALRAHQSAREWADPDSEYASFVNWVVAAETEMAISGPDFLDVWARQGPPSSRIKRWWHRQRMRLRAHLFSGDQGRPNPEIEGPTA